MKKNTIFIVLSIVLSLAFLTGGLLLLKKRDDLKKENNAQLERLRQEQVQLGQTDTPQKLDTIQKENEALQKEVDTLNSECENLDASNKELEQQYETLSQDEQNIYYLTILESLKKGMEKVEGYLNDAQ